MITKLKPKQILWGVCAVLASALNNRAPMQVADRNLQAGLDRMRALDMKIIDDLVKAVDQVSRENDEEGLSGEEQLKVQSFLASLFAATPHDDFMAPEFILDAATIRELMEDTTIDAKPPAADAQEIVDDEASQVEEPKKGAVEKESV